MFRKATVTVFFTMVLISSSVAGVGESAVITLSFPFGARSTAMGEVGTALADDGSALFFNPAGLGVNHRGWRKVGVSESHENILPAFKLSELWHHAITVTYQTPRPDIGGFGSYFHFLNMGRNEIFDAMGRSEREVTSYEWVFASGWGFSFAEVGDTTRYYGLTAKYFVSALAPGIGENGEGVANGFAFDIGYLHLFKYGFRYGITFNNMGPHVYYIDRNSRDPLPFTMNAAFGYKRRFCSRGIEFFRAAAEIRLDKELVINRWDDTDPEQFYVALYEDWFNEPLKYELQEINYHTGGEFRLFNTGSLRQGILFDLIGQRFEWHVGFGVTLFNHIRIDQSWIIAPPEFMKGLARKFDSTSSGSTGARNGQWQFTISVNGLGGWSKKDHEWWKTDNGREQW